MTSMTVHTHGRAFAQGPGQDSGLVIESPPWPFLVQSRFRFSALSSCWWHMTSMTRQTKRRIMRRNHRTEGKNELSWVTWRQTPFRLAAVPLPDAGPLNMPLSGGAVRGMPLYIALSILINWQGLKAYWITTTKDRLGTMVEPGAVIADDASKRLSWLSIGLEALPLPVPVEMMKKKLWPT